MLAALRPFSETPSGNHRIRRIRKFLNSFQLSDAEFYEEAVRVNSTSSVAQIMNKKSFTPIMTNFLQNLFEKSKGDSIRKALNTDISSFLPFNLLEGADRMSMMNSKELRLPYLDRSLMEYSMSLKTKFFIHGLNQKYVLKEAYKNILPKHIVNRTKRGFNPPVWHWLKMNPILLNDLLIPNSILHEYVNVNYLREMIYKLQNNKEDCSTQLWGLLILHRWLRKYF